MSTKQSVVFTTPQMKWLHKRAKELGITVSDVLRRLIDERRGVDEEKEAIRSQLQRGKIRGQAWKEIYAEQEKNG